MGLSGVTVKIVKNLVVNHRSSAAMSHEPSPHSVVMCYQHIGPVEQRYLLLRLQRLLAE